jgi:hypothetical protein
MQFYVLKNMFLLHIPLSRRLTAWHLMSLHVGSKESTERRCGKLNFFISEYLMMLCSIFLLGVVHLLVMVMVVD